jgi:signal transduction histidine kinase
MEIHEMMLIKAEIKDINLIFEGLNSLPEQVIGDKQRLQQVSINLISNAISNTFEGGVTVILNYNKRKQ